MRAGLLKKTGMTVAALIIFAAVVSNLFRSLTPLAEHYKQQVEMYLTQFIGQPVTIQSLKTGWYWFLPVLKFEQLTIQNKQSIIELGQLYVGINLFNSLRYRTIKPGLLYLKKAHLSLRKKANVWSMDGLKIDPDSSLTALLLALSQQGRLMVRDFSVDLYLEQQKKIPIRNINASMLNQRGHYKVKASAYLAQQKRTRLRALADFYFDSDQNKITQGRLYLSTHKVFLPQWNILLSPEIGIGNGEGSLKLWLDIKQNHFSAAQAELSLKSLSWNYKKYHSFIPDFYANMHWTPDRQGWIFSADKIRLQLEKTVWPENQISIRHHTAEQSYRIFSKVVLLKSLGTQLAFLQGKDIKALLAMRPDGLLESFHATIEQGQLKSILTRFDNISWQSRDRIPAVSHLSGALQWSPQAGRLALDSKNTHIQIPHYPLQIFTLINSVLEWKKAGDGFNILIKQIALIQPDVTLKIQGALEQVSRDSLGTIQLHLDFFAKNVEQWLLYLPKQHMKKQLLDWLQQNIRKISAASGNIKIQGKAADFPFDNQTGVFSIVSHLTGGTLTITPQWQPIKDIEGFIRVNNRDFEMDIVQGDAQGMPIRQMNLNIKDIGQGKETLLLHSIIHSNANKMLHFILASPIQEKLRLLKLMSIKGLLTLDLNLEIPLYPENDTNLIQGSLLLNDNLIKLNYPKYVVTIDDINGSLNFNESGIYSGSLKGTSFQRPLDIQIQTNALSNTLYDIKGSLLIAELKDQLKWPALSLLEGIVPFHAVLKTTSVPGKSSLTIDSALEGLAINVPHPLGKKGNEKALFHIEANTRPEAAYQIEAQYNNKLRGLFVFTQDNRKEISFQSGQIYLGNHAPETKLTKGLGIAGVLDEYHYEEWEPILGLNSDQNASSTSSPVTSFDFSWNKLSLFQQSLDKLSVKGILLPSGEWSLLVKQKKIVADLIYNVGRHTINGFIHYLHLDKIKLNGNNTIRPQLQPKEIPDLNLRIDDLKVDDVLIGNVTIKSHSKDSQWTTDYCLIETPAYKIQLDGQWTAKNDIHQTRMQIKMHIDNLAKSLQQWHINPVVDANRGELFFNGGWNDALYNFSLAKINGALSLQLYDGRITHLNKETEEKLGLGKLLSILSLQTIPRRLKLDFSDLSKDGYSFDVFKGNFSLVKGIMSTKDSYIDGPVAYASMTGDLDILRQFYNLNLNISPHITASLPVVATLAGGPIAGVAAWVASKIINQGMQKITAYSYTISGPWSDPVIHQFNMIKTMIRK